MEMYGDCRYDPLGRAGREGRKIYVHDVTHVRGGEENYTTVNDQFPDGYYIKLTEAVDICPLVNGQRHLFEEHEADLHKLQLAYAEVQEKFYAQKKCNARIKNIMATGKDIDRDMILELANGDLTLWEKKYNV